MAVCVAEAASNLRNVGVTPAVATEQRGRRRQVLLHSFQAFFFI